VNPNALRVDRRTDLDYITRRTKRIAMKAETEKSVAEIEQVLTLLRRHL